MQQPLRSFTDCQRRSAFPRQEAIPQCKNQAVRYGMQDVNHQLFSDSVKNECLSANPNATNQEIENLLNSFDLLDCIDRHPLTLSGGQRQRLAICQALLGKKKLLIFDEPTSGLDFRHMCQVTERLKQLSQHGYILFVVTHDYEFLNRACNCYVRIDKIN